MCCLVATTSVIVCPGLYVAVIDSNKLTTSPDIIKIFRDETGGASSPHVIVLSPESAGLTVYDGVTLYVYCHMYWKVKYY